MKIKIRDKNKAIQKIREEIGGTEHEAIDVWVKMSNKDRKRMIRSMKGA